MIVTFNLSDFPASALLPYEIEAQHPDKFVRNLLEEEQERFLNVIREVLAALKNPPKTLEDYLETLRKNSLGQTAALLELH